MRRLTVFLLALSAAHAEVISIVNARIFPLGGPVMEKATLVIDGAKIAAVGPGVKPRPKSRIIDGNGLSVYPGWIDGWSRVGLVEISGVVPTVDTTEVGTFNPAAKAWISVNPHSEMIKTARVNGITTALVAPTGGLISGVASAMNLLGKYPNEMVVLGDAAVVLNVPSQRARSARRPSDTAEGATDSAGRRSEEQLTKLREYMREAKRYSDARNRAGAKVPVDPSLEALVPVMRGERPVICPADHFRDIRTAVEFGQEFGLKVIIAGGADAWKIADYLRQKNVGVLYSGVLELPRSAEDPYDAAFAAPEVLRRAGVPFAIVSASSADVRNLPYRAAVAAAYGLEREDALKSITLWPAELLGISDKVGSIQEGKLANLLITKGDPLDIRSEVKYVFVEGKEVPPGNRNLDMFEEFRQQPATK